jgi:hypothetical protein
MDRRRRRRHGHVSSEIRVPERMDDNQGATDAEGEQSVLAD